MLQRRPWSRDFHLVPDVQPPTRLVSCKKKGAVAPCLPDIASLSVIGYRYLPGTERSLADRALELAVLIGVSDICITSEPRTQVANQKELAISIQLTYFCSYGGRNDAPPKRIKEGDDWQPLITCNMGSQLRLLIILLRYATFINAHACYYLVFSFLKCIVVTTELSDSFNLIILSSFELA